MALVSQMSFIPKGSNGFSPPTSTERSQFRLSLIHLLNGRLETAFNGFQVLDMDLLKFNDIRGKSLFLIREKPASSPRGLGLFVIDPAYSRNLVLQAPHPVADQSTETEAADFFLKLTARGLLIAGSHRCANSDSSSCSGTTSVCSTDGSSISYKTSDAAHSTEQLFEVAHEVFMDFDSNTVALAFHGFSQGPGEPHSYISDGTKILGSSDHLPNQLASELNQSTGLSTAAKSCNDGTPGSMLCGTEDLQGRYANQSPNACTLPAPSTSGRFLHIEQSLDLRTEGGEVNPGQLLGALEAVF